MKNGSSSRWKHDFRNNTVIKNPLQKNLYRTAGYYVTSNTLVVAGPDIERHVMDSRTFVSRTKSSKVTVVELKKDIYLEQVAELEALDTGRGKNWTSWRRLGGKWEDGDQFPITHNLKIIHSDIADAVPERFIDADLMGSIKTTGKTLVKVISKQFKKFGYQHKNKAFLFTTSIRNVGEYETLKWIEQVLMPVIGQKCQIHDTKLRLTNNSKTRRNINGFNGITLQKYTNISYNKNGRLKKFKLFYYNDGGTPMVTGIIVYQ